MGLGNFLAVQWLLGAFTVTGQGSIPSQGTKIPQATEQPPKTEPKQTKNLNTNNRKK